jgi:hypothetical protein
VYVDLRLVPENQTADKWFDMIPKNASSRKACKAKIRLILRKDTPNGASTHKEEKDPGIFKEAMSKDDTANDNPRSPNKPFVYGNLVFLQPKRPVQVSRAL